MKIAIPLFDQRVSPRFDCAQDILLASVKNGDIVKRRKLSSAGWNPRERVKQLYELGVDILLQVEFDTADFDTVSYAFSDLVSVWMHGEYRGLHVTIVFNIALDDTACKNTGSIYVWTRAPPLGAAHPRPILAPGSGPQASDPDVGPGLCSENLLNAIALHDVWMPASCENEGRSMTPAYPLYGVDPTLV